MKRYELKDFSILDTFNCGIPEMDDFIHNRLEQSVKSHFCTPYVLMDEEKVVAFFSLSADSLYFDDDGYFDDFMDGYSGEKPLLSSSYLPTFKNKEHYPAIDISYLAVSDVYQHQGLGSALLEDIIQFVKDNSIAGCQFVVVDALVIPGYSALAFYSKNGFSVCEDKKAYKDCVRMYRVLYPSTQN